MIGRAVVLFLAMTSVGLADSPLDSLDLRTETLGVEGVGRLDISDRGFCTGVLIDNDLVLTAAHCLFDGTKRIDPRTITFKAGLRHGEAVAESAVRRAVIASAYKPDDTDPERRIRNDVALLQLVQGIPLAVAAAFETAGGLTMGEEVSVLSYGRGRTEALSWQESCRVTAQGTEVYAFTCDTIFGSSGAPVLRGRGDHARVVSIISGGTYDSETVLSFGMAVHDVAATLRQRFIDGDGVFPPESVQGRRIQTGGNRDVGGARFLRP